MTVVMAIRILAKATRVSILRCSCQTRGGVSDREGWQLIGIEEQRRRLTYDVA